jgi:hypothetical protein
MSEEKKAEEIQNAFWMGKLGFAAIWTGLCGLFWITMIVGMANQPPDPALDQQARDTALGMAGCIATGCAGSVWLGGLIILLIVYAIFRR